MKPLLSNTFPQGIQIFKNVGYLTSGSGDKNMFKGYLKSKQKDGRMDKRTNRHTDGNFDL